MGHCVYKNLISSYFPKKIKDPSREKPMAPYILHRPIYIEMCNFGHFPLDKFEEMQNCKTSNIC